jgi:S-DNA-T family DNA segregation ATPase FtsK/SpoIIIE
MRQRLGSTRLELTGLALIVLAIVVLLGLLSVTSGAVSDGIANLLRQVFGWGAVPVGAAMGAAGVWLLVTGLSCAAPGLTRGPAGAVRWDVVVVLEVLFLAGLALLHLLSSGDDPLMQAAAGEGGGLLGWGVSAALADLIGRTAAGLLLLSVILATLGTSLFVWAGKAWQPDGRRRSPDGPGTADIQDDQQACDASERLRPRARRLSSEMQAVPLNTGHQEKSRAVRRSHHLPPLDLLVPSSKDVTTGADVRYQAQILEETLQAFGVPARVREINVGPAVTQFGVEPGYIERTGPDGSPVRQRVRVSKITALINDLSLALAAAPIRIEAPVPGRPLVGIEVPNAKVSLVALRGVLESEPYRKAKGDLLVALGRDVSGAAVVADLVSMPHLLIAGATGSGKSVCINTILTGLLCDHTPDELRLLLVDPKMVELVHYTGVPHLLAPVIVDLDQVVGALAWVTRMMDQRYQLFSRSGARNIVDYNKKAARQRGEELLPYIVVVIDELADLMMMAPDEVERYVTRIAQMARATGIHMVIATQRPSVDVVTGLIKANFPARIAFMVTSQIDSRVILDVPGAERLLGRGDALLMLPDSAKLQRLQGCFVSDDEINRVVSFWKEDAGDLETPGSLPWAGFVDEAERDAMLEEAIDLVSRTGRASTTLLQRRLGIGYPRAARLMDQLEEEGIIGPATGSHPREVLIESRADDGDEDRVEHREV